MLCCVKMCCELQAGLLANLCASSGLTAGKNVAANSWCGYTTSIAYHKLCSFYTSYYDWQMLVPFRFSNLFYIQRAGSLQSQLTAQRGKLTWPPPSAPFMIIIWPLGLANAHELMVSVGCLNVAKLLSLMVTIYSSEAPECNLRSSAGSGNITIKITPHGWEYFWQIIS